MYDPTEYEKQLIAAGWITIEEADPDYAEYRRHSVYHDYALDYRAWKNAQSELNRLGEEFDKRFPPTAPNPPYGREFDEMNALLNQMSVYEEQLGY
jgi:hypothetical protein